MHHIEENCFVFLHMELCSKFQCLLLVINSISPERISDVYRVMLHSYMYLPESKSVGSRSLNTVGLNSK